MHIANNFTFHSLVKKKGNFVCAYFNHVKFLDANMLPPILPSTNAM